MEYIIMTCMSNFKYPNEQKVCVAVLYNKQLNWLIKLLVPRIYQMKGVWSNEA